MIRRAMGTAVLIIFGVICAGLIAEAGVRVANRFFPYFYCYDAARGWGLRPNTAGYYRREGAAYVEINSGGFRGPEFARPKPPGTVRIAVLGDSYTEAIQVPYEDTFASVAARKLAQSPLLKGRRVEALNFGVDGYGTTQELMTLREQVWAYQPDIVVLAIFLGNDVRNNSVSLEGNLCRPFYVERDGKLAPAGPLQSSNSFRLWCMARFDYRKSGLLSLIGGAWTILRTRNEQPTAELPVERAINYDIYKPPTTPTWRDAWQVTDDLVEETHREAARHGAAFLTVTLDTSIQVWPDPKVRENFMKRIGVSDLFYPDRRIAALGERDGFDVLTLAEPLYQYAQAHHAFLHGFANSRIGFGHWNVEGHRVAGELIGERLCAMLERRQMRELRGRTSGSARLTGRSRWPGARHRAAVAARGIVPARTGRRRALRARRRPVRTMPHDGAPWSCPRRAMDPNLRPALAQPLVELHDYPVGILEQARQHFLARRLAISDRVRLIRADEDLHSGRLEPLDTFAQVAHPEREMMNPELVDFDRPARRLSRLLREHEKPASGPSAH